MKVESNAEGKPRQCAGCSRVCPADAFYCYYDGTPLLRDLQAGPMQLGSKPFPTILYFSDGQACANFNQLALTCNNRWEEAKALLTDGIWPTFFAGMGRLDLAAVAKQVAQEPDLDRGLSRLLEKLPADLEFLRPPKVSVETAEPNLGQLAPGTDKKFELVIANQGMLLLHGTVTSGSDWLVFDSRTGPSQKIFQTRNFCTIPVWALGAKLRAGMAALKGEIVLDTNGGMLTVPVKAEIPIRPFPKGVYANDVLAGARTPRDIAVKAREFPNEAAVLFEQGAVKAWYESNGWTYPVEGSQGSGKGAVQQFFEALGLAKPPRLEINTVAFILKGKVGQRLSKTITVGTEEAKPVYAQAWSNQNWVSFGPIKYQGNQVKIPVDITVPPQPGVTMSAQIVIRGNGNQQFTVPVSLDVDGAPVVVALAPDTDESDLVPAHQVSVVDDSELTLWDRCVEWLNNLFGKPR
jgi:hypothetical protein